jgi:hypothetical protein
MPAGQESSGSRSRCRGSLSRQTRPPLFAVTPVAGGNAVTNVVTWLAELGLPRAFVPNGTEPLPYLAPGAEMVVRIPLATLKILQH